MHKTVSTSISQRFKNIRLYSFVLMSTILGSLKKMQVVIIKLYGIGMLVRNKDIATTSWFSQETRLVNCTMNMEVEC